MSRRSRTPWPRSWPGSSADSMSSPGPSRTTPARSSCPRARSSSSRTSTSSPPGRPGRNARRACTGGTTASPWSCHRSGDRPAGPAASRVAGLRLSGHQVGPGPMTDAPESDAASPASSESAPDGLDGPAPALEAHGIVKRFPGTLANDHVDFDLQPGEIHALLGENGAGKSTLMNVLIGLYRPDAGEIRIDGRAVSFGSPRDAIAAGIGMVHQHFTLVPAQTVTENILLGLDKPRFRLRLREAEAEVARIAGTVGLRV